MTAQVRFDEAEARTSTSVTTDGSVLKSIRQAAASAGIDPVAELYNEALELAHDGHYGIAQARLHVLLGLAPSDGEAHLLLAKVLVAGQQWRRAISALDEAAQCGAVVPEELRVAVIRHLNDDHDSLELERQARLAREQGEIRKLRSEARTLRSDNAHLIARNRALEKETYWWAWTTTIVAVVAIGFIGARWFFGAAPVATTEVPVPEPEVILAEDPASAPVGDSPRNQSLAEVAGAALMEAGVLDGAELEVVVRSSTAQLSGTVPTHAQMRRAAEEVGAVPGIEEVGTEGVIILALRDGMTHTVQSGETLGEIAYDHYGKSSYYQDIIDANPNLGGKTNLKVGQSLTLPPIREDVE